MSSFPIGAGAQPVHLTLNRANRHGLIAGATGTGKTVTLQVLAEGFSRAGVPVFLADVKGDLSGLCQAGDGRQGFIDRAADLGMPDYEPAACPTLFWDLYGKAGHPVRTTISDMGPLMLSRLLDLNDTQEGVLTVTFAVADAEGLLLLDLKDLRSMLAHVGENAKAIGQRYGSVSPASVGAIQRRLLVLEQEGAAHFFGEPALDIRDLMRVAPNGHGHVNLLVADKLVTAPRLYATFLLWLLSELFEELPEVGDPDKPTLVFFFDEAHLLFDRASPALVEKVEQVVRLIRSKGVGVYFVTQSPADVPDDVLGQLGNRVQHALRAFTPRDRKAVKAAAETFRPNPSFEAADVITELGVGEALVSTLDAGGVPSVVARARICPPRSRLGPAEAAVRAAVQSDSPVAGRYDTPIDRDSAHEMLQRRAAKTQETAGEAAGEADGETTADGERRPRGSRRQGIGEALARSVVRSVGSSVGRSLGRSLVRGLLGSLLRG